MKLTYDRIVPIDGDVCFVRFAAVGDCFFDGFAALIVAWERKIRMEIFVWA